VWENALNGSGGGVQKGWDAIQPGETCFVGGGQYAGATLPIGSGGTAGKYKKLVGKTGDDPRFTSARATWDGTGSGMDSQRYGKARGYHSGSTARVVRARPQK